MIYFPKRIELELSSFCNAKCVSCTRVDIDEDNGIMYYNPFGVRDLNLDLEFLQEKFFYQPWFKDVKSLYSIGNNGDPMSHPGIAEIYREAKKHGRNLELSMHTNGSLGKTETFEELAEIITGQGSSIIFSIDGLEDTNHLYRAGVSWKRLMHNVKTYINAGGIATWKFIVFKHNEHQVGQAKKLAYDLGFKNFRISSNLMTKEVAEKKLQKLWKTNFKLVKEFKQVSGLPPPNGWMPGYKQPKQLWIDRVELEPECTRDGWFYVTSDKRFFPCCNTYYCSSDNYKEFYDWFNEDGDWNDLTKYSVEEVLKHKKMYELVSTFDKPKINRLCAENCKK